MSLAILASLHHLPATFLNSHIYYTNLPAGALCELPPKPPVIFARVRLPRPVRVHRLPRKLGLRAAAPIVRVECGRGVG